MNRVKSIRVARWQTNTVLRPRYIMVVMSNELLYMPETVYE